MNKIQSPTVVKKLNHSQKYATARANLLLMIIATLINVVLLFTGSDSMLLFSATIPYFSVLFGTFSEVTAIATGCYILAATTVAVYFICWLMSKKHHGWLIVSLVMFVIDCALLGYLYITARDASGILDALFHVWILYYLITGIISGAALKKLPAEEPTAPEAAEAVSVADEAAPALTETVESNLENITSTETVDDTDVDAE